MRRAIAKHRRDFIAVVFLVVVAVLVGGFILSNQRFYAPKWVPIVGSDFFTLKGEFSTAQSVTPGQGQTVNIAGVRVGDIQKVDLVDGRAVVTMKIKRKYAHIYKDATMLLRPKTQLNDMIIELSPGTRSSGEVEDGGDDPGLQLAAQRQPGRVPRHAGRRHARLPAPAAGRRGRGPARPGQEPLGDVPALRAHGPRPGEDEQPARRAARQPQARHPQLPAALHRAGQARRPAREVRRQLQRRLPDLRRPGRQHPRHDLAAARRAERDAERAGQDRRAGQGPRPRAGRPAARRPRARPGPEGVAALLREHDADDPRPDPPVRARRPRRRSRSCARRPRTWRTSRRI